MNGRTECENVGLPGTHRTREEDDGVHEVRREDTVGNTSINDAKEVSSTDVNSHHEIPYGVANKYLHHTSATEHRSLPGTVTLEPAVERETTQHAL